jgi:aminopeptidase YwaD
MKLTYRGAILAVLWSALISSAAASPEIAASDIRDHIKYLASDELEGRLAISPQYVEASKYCADLFAAYGLEPKGSDGYFQPFEMSAGWRVGKNNFLYCTDRIERIDFEQGEDYLPVPGGRANKWAEGPVAFIGFGIEREDYNDYTGMDVKGKVLLMVRDRPEGIPGGTITGRVRNAAEKGAAGVILLTRRTSGGDKIALFGVRLRTQDPIEIPVAQMTRAAAERLLGGKRILDIVEGIDQSQKPNSFDLKGVRARFITQIELNRGQSRNVVGFMPGHDPDLRNQIIVVGAHLDHIGHGEVGSLAGTNEIHNGADDNASGSAGVLELAEYYTNAASNRRSMLFILFGGEEEGLLGSSHYVNDPTVDLNSVTAMVNLDMIGRLEENKLDISGVGSAAEWSGWIDQCAPAGLVITKGSSGTGGSDHTSFYRKHIPVLFLFTGIHGDYHRPTDDWDKINYEGEVQVLQCAVQLVDTIDGYGEKMVWQSTEGQGGTGRRTDEEDRGDGTPRDLPVRVGVIPDFGYEGPGLRLAGVSPDTPAERAGLKEGDIILKWGDFDVEDLESLTEAFRQSKPGVGVKVKVRRGNEEIEITITPEASG